MSDSIMIEIKQGKLKGKIGEDYKGNKYFSFQGIPYAQPPIGHLRFKSPVEAEKWDGILDATKEGNSSISHNFLLRKKVIGSEDCLYLNVYTPQLPKKEKNFKPKAVMFWIHGGGFLYGSGDTDIYGPEYLITKDVVLVTINYRLGILGFLSLEDQSLEIPGNAGLKDMVQALKWVQANIAQFDGDPKNVTIFGESAGAASCHLLILSPMATGLFHKAILQSGCALNPWLYGSRIAKKLGQVLGFKSTNEKDILEYLQTIPADKFLEAQDLLEDSLDCDAIRPVSFVIEEPSSTENFITQHPLKIIASGKYNKVPIIIGYTNREGLITEASHLRKFGSLNLELLQNFESKIPWYYQIEKGSDLSKSIGAEIKKFYFGHDELSLANVDQYFKLETDVLFWRGIYVTIREHLKQLDQIYFYRLTMDTNLNLIKMMAKITRPGVCHCDDLGYLFKTDLLPKFTSDSKEAKGVETMVTLWTNFAKTSNPNSSTTETLLNIKWKQSLKDNFNCLDIGEAEVSDLDRMEFWNGISSNPLINSAI